MKLTKVSILLASGFLLIGFLIGKNIRGNEDNSPQQKIEDSNTPQVFSTAEASRPESILKSMYDAQLDCLNTFNTSGVPSPMGPCFTMTSVYTVNNQNVEVICGAQNVPSKEQIKINPATIKGDTALIEVFTNWQGGKPAIADAELKLINNRWRVSSIVCRTN